MVLFKVLPGASLADLPPRVRSGLNSLLNTCGRVLVVTFENVVRIMGAIVDQVVSEAPLRIRHF
jgi:hypothetical protein